MATRKRTPVVEEEDEALAPRASSKPKPKARNGDPAAAWKTMLDELQAGSSGPNFFLKAGKTRIRLVPEPGTEDDETPTFFIPVTSVFRGKERPKYLLSAVVLAAEGREIPEDKQGKVLPVVAPKSVLQEILNNLADGWELFDPQSGHGISITKTGSGLGTDYSVTMSPKPIPFSTEPEPMGMTLVEAAAEFQRRSAQNKNAEMGDEPEEGEEEAPSRNGRGRRASPAAEGW